VGAPAAVLYRSLREVFAGHVAVWPGQVMRMYASRRAGVVTDSPEALAARWRGRRDDALGSFGARRFGSLFDPELVAEAHARLGRMAALPNRDASPVATLYGLVLWDQRARGADRVSPLWELRRIGSWWLLAPLALLAAARALWRRRASRRARDGLWSTATGGLAGLALEVLLLFVYQNVEGSLYAALGVLVALFMLGLALGTVASARWCAGRDAAGVRRWAAWVDAATIAVILVVPALATTGWLAGVGLVAVGLCTGAVFPPAVADLERHASASRAAGLADAADHLGATVGALTVGLVVLPVAGLWGAALALALLKAASLVGWLGKG
jgi:spermidine synthase